jgi:Protein of unknown function (DUF3102)
MSKSEPNSFQAPDLAEHVSAIRTLARTTIDNIIEIGRHLTECKRIVGHGNWLPWLAQEFAWSEDTAERFMQAYRVAGEAALRAITAGKLYIAKPEATLASVMSSEVRQ